VLKETYLGTYAFRESEAVGNGRDFIVPFSLGPHIASFRHCQPFLCVDGTFLTFKYTVQILTAIALDASNHILPLALVFVESENCDSWLWFSNI
jgi:hypothetical protein